MMSDTLKKLGLGGLVAITLVAYGVKARHEAGVVTPPASLNSPASGSSSSSSSGSSSGSASSSSSSGQTAGTYKDGQYTGSVQDAFYGYVQVQATVKSGKLTDVQFLQYPNDRSTSVEINSQAMPYLQQEALQAQSAQVDIVSGATDTSQAFIRSLGDALSQAQG